MLRIKDLCRRGLVVFAACWLLGSTANANEKVVVGYLEYAVLVEPDLRLQAKIDTGADHSSLNARAIERFKRNGERWVRFEVPTPDGKDVRIERPVVRRVRILEHASDDSKRIVVQMQVCLGTTSRLADVNLVDRSRFRSELLIGRSYLVDAFLVDPGREFIAPPRCATKK